MFVAVLVGLSNSIPIDQSASSGPSVNIDGENVEGVSRLSRRQLDISGGTVQYDDSDSLIVPQKRVANDDPAPVAVYEIVPKFIDGWPSSNLLNADALFVEEPLENVVSIEEDPMELAETHIFRPLFRYRAVQDEKNRRRIEDDSF